MQDCLPRHFLQGRCLRGINYTGTFGQEQKFNFNMQAMQVKVNGY